jgi:hypothetical protein
LRVDPVNPRYFSDGAHPVYLTGSHVWLDLQDLATYTDFDFTGFLNFLSARNYNFIRLWNLDSPYYQLVDPPPGTVTLGVSQPNGLPFARPGPDVAADAGPKFDLSQFNQDYFDRLRARVIAAGNHGVYVSIMLFNGAWINGGSAASWTFSQYNPTNNVNGYTMAEGDCYTMNNATWVALMDAYVDKVIDTVNDLNNVLFEVINEAPPASKNWQYHVIGHIKAYETNKPKQHPVGMTAYDSTSTDAATNLDLVQSSADWISLSGRVNPTYTTAVLDAPATKVSILDTNHTWGLDPAGDDSAWVWKSLTRGHNPIYLDSWTFASGHPPDANLRTAMTLANLLAGQIDLEHMVPNDTVSSTGYALANTGTSYLVYQPGTVAFTVALPAASYNYQWIDPTTGVAGSSINLSAPGGETLFTPPAEQTGGSLLYITVGP